MSLYDVDSLPSASAVANALVELAQPWLNKAWTYVAQWDGLKAARVPAPFRRELLGRDSLGELDLESESLVAVRDWARRGAQAPRIIVGSVGVGKSYAGARWALDRHRQGCSTLWVSVSSWTALDLNALHAELRRALEATALVIDDLGVGVTMYKHDNSGKKVLSYLGEVVQLLLLDRTNHGRPTLILLNGDPKAVLGIVGRRLIDRLKLLPDPDEPLVVIKSTASLRKALPEDAIDPDGRGRAYWRAFALLDTFGAVNESGVPFDFLSGSSRVLTTEPRFGDKLITLLTTRYDWLDEAERARKLIGLDTAVLLERARLIEADTETGWAAEANKLLASLHRDLSRQRQQETEAKARAAAEIVRPALGKYRDNEIASWRDGPYGKMIVPELDVARLRELGFRVESTDHGTWTLRRETVPTKSPKAKARKKRNEAPRTAVLSFEHPTEADAWALANAIAFGILATGEHGG